MEIFFTRFSHLSQEIFNCLDNKNLSKCREISRSWHNYLDTKKFSQVRFIKGILEDWHEETHSWTKFKVPASYQLVFDKANAETIIELGIAVNQFYIYAKEASRGWYKDNIWGIKTTKTTLSDQGLTPLHIAAATGYVSLYENLRKIAKVKNPNDFDGRKPLHHAAYYGCLEMCQFIMLSKKTRDKNPKCKYGSNPLYWAASNGHLGVCKFIIENVKDHNRKNQTGHTPLHRAAQFGHLEICKQIMNKLEDKNPKNNGGKTPLHEAAWHGQVDVCELIIGYLDDKNPKDEHGKTPFYEAARLGHFKVCELLIKHSIDKNPVGIFGESALHAAAVAGYFEICKLIISNIDDKNPKNIKRNDDDWCHGETPLHGAAVSGHTNIYSLIMDCVADKNPKDFDGKTPLHIAAENGHLDICTLILENPSVEDKNPKCFKSWDREYCRDFKGETPLHLAAKGRHLEICQLIISYTKDKSPKRTDGKTPGQLAHKKCYGYYDNMKSSQHYHQDSVCKLLGEDGDLCSSLHVDIQDNKSISKGDFLLRIEAAASQDSNIVPDGKRRKI